MLVLVAALAVVGAAPARAAITDTFNKVFSANTSGAIAIRGNTVVSCQSDATSCADARANVTPQNNNFFFMTYADIDADPATFDSTSAAVDLPLGSSVLFAALTWGGSTTAGNVVNSAAFGTGTPSAAPTPADAGNVKFKVAGASAYRAMVSSRTSFVAGTGSYQGYVDVTALVQAAGNGTYTVADVQTGTGGNIQGGWGLTIAYANPADPPRNLAVFSGFGSVGAGQQVDIPVGGFVTPLTGSVKTTLGEISYEGDVASTGDQMQLGNTVPDLRNVVDALHPVANTFASVISAGGLDTTARLPNYSNQLGYDAATINVDGFLANNTTTAVIRLTSAAGVGETYYPGVVSFATDLYAPNLTVTKSVAVTQKGAGNTRTGVPEPGDRLRYTVVATNTGQDDATDTVLSDTIPAGTTFVSGSLTVGGTPLTDAGGDDVGVYRSGTPGVEVNLGTDATTGAGGTVAIGATTATVTFDVTINGGIADGTSIDNSAHLAYVGGQTGLDVSSVSNTVTVVALRRRSALSITKTADVPRIQRGAGTAVTYTLTARNDGPYADPSVTVADDLPPGATVVSATPASGSCTTTGRIVCTVGAIANGATKTVTVVVHLDAAADPAVDTATVSGTNLDIDAGDDTAALNTVVNGPPLAADDAATTTAGTVSVAVLANDSDPDDDPLTVAAGSTPPTKGTIVVNSDRTISYTATGASAGLDTFSYVVSDGRGGTASATVRVTIPNSPPEATPDTATTTRGTPVDIAVLDNDSDPNIPGSGQVLAVSAVTQPAAGAGSVTTDGVTVTFSPSTGFRAGVATFGYVLSDGAGGSDTATVTVTIPDETPVAVADTATTPYLTAVTVDVLGNDTDANGDSLTVTGVSVAVHGTATIVGGAVRYAPAPGWSGSEALTYTVSDGTNVTTGVLNVGTGNGSPVAGSYPVTVARGVSTTLDVLAHATDPNEDTVVLVSAGPAAHGSVSVVAGRVVYTPAEAYAGTDSFNYTVGDGHGGTATATVTITIPIPGAPAPADRTSTGIGAAPQAVTIPPVGAMTLLDAAGNPTSGPVVVAGQGSYSRSGNTITFTPLSDFIGAAAAVTYRVTDAYGQHGDATYAATVTLPPGPIAPDRTTRGVGTTPQTAVLPVPPGGTIALLDPDGVPVTAFTVAGQGTYRLTLNRIASAAAAAFQVPELLGTVLADTNATNGASITFIAVLGYTGTAPPVEYQVTDAYGQTAVATYTPTVVLPVLAAPPARASTGRQTDPQHVTLPVPAGGTVALLDAHGRPVARLTVAGQGTYHLDPITGTLTFTPLAGFTGTPDPITYQVTDAYGQKATATYAPAVSGNGILPTTGSPVLAVGIAGLLTMLCGAGILIAGSRIRRTRRRPTRAR